MFNNYFCFVKLYWDKWT